MPTTPVSLSDTQLSSVMRAANPLTPQARVAFLQEVAVALAAVPDIGDGQLHQLLAMIQKRHFDPPIDSGHHHGPRHLGSKRDGN
jgi:hypothetical protein